MQQQYYANSVYANAVDVSATFSKTHDVSERHSNVVLRALGQRIRELRTERGYSQEAFADQCGVHRTFMGTVERGESNLSFQNILKVATTLDITLSVLFSDIEEKSRTLTAKAVKVKSGSLGKENLAKPPRARAS
jgi:transcriptional regulator with XRE-family HTH domain